MRGSLTEGDNKGLYSKVKYINFTHLIEDDLYLEDWEISEISKESENVRNGSAH